MSILYRGLYKIELVANVRRDRLFEKAMKLVESRRVEPLGYGVFNVIGDHGTYTVVQDYTGKLSCSCPGFMQKAKCSHVEAVVILTKIMRKR